MGPIRSVLAGWGIEVRELPEDEELGGGVGCVHILLSGEVPDILREAIPSQGTGPRAEEKLN